jgi:hypothetical protein
LGGLLQRLTELLAILAYLLARLADGSELAADLLQLVTERLNLPLILPG